MKHYFLINPAAGKKRSKEDFEQMIRSFCKEHQLEYDIYYTLSLKDAERKVREVCEQTNAPTRFYACGGDGTFQAIACGCMGFEFAEATVLPCGSGNDFIKSFPNPDDFSSLEKQTTGVSFPCDILKVNDRYAVNLANIGFDANIAKDMVKFKRLPLINGPAAYNVALFFNLFKPLSRSMTITVDDGEPQTQKETLISLANAKYYGGGYQAAPRAELNDGLIDLCMVGKVSLPRVAKILPYYKRGEHLELGLDDLIQYCRCKKVRIQSEKPIAVCLDGEIVLETDIQIEIIPNAFMLSVPESCDIR